jgi:hypothetical protein
MAPTSSAATLITASIHITATLVHIPRLEKRPSIISTETKCVMDAATQAAEVMEAAEAIARNSVTAEAKTGIA